MAVHHPQIAVYRLIDLAEEIDLSQLALERLRLFRARRGAVKFQRPPATVELGTFEIEGQAGAVSARIYDFGVAVLRWRTELGPRLGWEELQAAADRLIGSEAIDSLFAVELERLEAMVAPALLGPVEPVEERLREEFAVIHLAGVDLEGPLAGLVERPEVAELVLGERAEFTASVRRELEQYAFGYSHQDLAVLGFDRVLIVDPEGIWDVADLVELAHAELLELGYYDRLLQRELELLPGFLARRPGMLRSLVGGRHARLLHRLMVRHAEITEVRSRLLGALTITEDLFYAKVYRRAMALYGTTELAETMETRLRVLTDVYSMVNGEVNARRAEVLELGILILVFLEVIRAFW